VSVVAEQLIGHRERARQFFDAKAVIWSAKYAPDGGRASRLTDVVSGRPAGERERRRGAKRQGSGTEMESRERGAFRGDRL